MVLAQHPRSTRAAAARTVHVRVRGGYQPSVLRGRVGEPLRIVFAREETAACSEHVVFPAFGKSAMLPPFEETTLELVPERAGEYEFTCQLGMLRGRLVVDAGASKRLTSALSVLAERARRPWPTIIAAERRDTIALALVAWLCSLPLLLLIAVPFLGWRTGGVVALLWLGVVAAACFAVCASRVSTLQAEHVSQHPQAQDPS